MAVVHKQSLAGLKRALVRNASQGRERRLFLDETARRIAEHGEPGVVFLLERIGKAKDDEPRAIFLGLTFAPKAALRRLRDRIRVILLKHTRDSRELVAAQAIDALRLLDFKDTQAELLPLLTHQSAYVVGSVLRFLSRHDPAAARPRLIDALRSPSPIVRQNAIDELDELECTQALSEIRRLLTDPDPDVRQAAQTAAANLAEIRASDDAGPVDGKRARTRRPA